MKRTVKQAFAAAKQRVPEHLKPKLKTLRKQGWVYAADKEEAHEMQQALPEGMTSLVYYKANHAYIGSRPCWRLEVVKNYIPGLGG